MEEHFHLPCAVENDVNCAGLAESISGAGKGSRINLCLTVGTGIGGCLVVDGKVFHGASNSACEVGYMHLAPGAFQDEAATSALVRRVTERKKAEVWDGFRIFEAAKAGDPICQEELDRLADLLGMGIANICFVINPERIILGGGIMEQEAYMKPGSRLPWKNIWFLRSGNTPPSAWPPTRITQVCWERCIICRQSYPGKFYKFMMPGSKGQKAVHACMIRLLNLGPAKHEKAAIYAVNQRISNVYRIAGAALQRSNS